MNFKRIRPWLTYNGSMPVDMNHRDSIAAYNDNDSEDKRVILWWMGNWGGTIIRYEGRSSAP